VLVLHHLEREQHVGAREWRPIVPSNVGAELPHEVHGAVWIQPPRPVVYGDVLRGELRAVGAILGEHRQGVVQHVLDFARAARGPATGEPDDEWWFPGGRDGEHLEAGARGRRFRRTAGCATTWRSGCTADHREQGCHEYCHGESQPALVERLFRDTEGDVHRKPYISH